MSVEHGQIVLGILAGMSARELKSLRVTVKTAGWGVFQKFLCGIQAMQGQCALDPECEEKHRQRMIGLNNFIINMEGFDSYVDERILEAQAEIKKALSQNA